MKAYLLDALYIPLKNLSVDQVEMLRERYTYQFYKDSSCGKCEYMHDRPCDVCENCPANLGTVRLARAVTRKGKDYFTIPSGDEKGAKKMLPGLEVINKCADVPFSRPIKFIGKLRSYQKPAVRDLCSIGYGVLNSKPRTGKTVMAAAVICQLGQKTLIIAAQRDWLINFYETFVGSEKEKPMTDVSKNKIGFCKKYEEFKKYDICLATYHTFLSDRGKQLLEKISTMFPVLFVDEVHRGAATGHARVIRSMCSSYKFGLSGTPDRKDGKYKIVDDLVGPVAHQTHVESLRPTLRMVETNVQNSHNYKNWTYMVRYLETHPKRLKLIAEWAVKDAAAGHMVLIPLARVDVIRALTKAINKIAGKNIAAMFYGGVRKDERDSVIQRAREYKVKVIVGNIRLLSTGINIPRASCLYQCTPSSNMPNAEQRYNRVLTPMPGKPTPMYRVFADDMKVVRSCFRAEWWGVVAKKIRPIMTDKTKMRLLNWMNGKPLNHEGPLGRL